MEADTKVPTKEQVKNMRQADLEKLRAEHSSAKWNALKLWEKKFPLDYGLETAALRRSQVKEFEARAATVAAYAAPRFLTEAEAQQEREQCLAWAREHTTLAIRLEVQAMLVYPPEPKPKAPPPVVRVPPPPVIQTPPPKSIDHKENSITRVFRFIRAVGIACWRFPVGAIQTLFSAIVQGLKFILSAILLLPLAAGGIYIAGCLLWSVLTFDPMMFFLSLFQAFCFGLIATVIFKIVGAIWEEEKAWVPATRSK